MNEPRLRSYSTSAATFPYHTPHKDKRANEIKYIRNSYCKRNNPLWKCKVNRMFAEWDKLVVLFVEFKRHFILMILKTRLEVIP